MRRFRPHFERISPPVDDGSTGILKSVVKTQPAGGTVTGQLALAPVPFFEPLPGAVALPEPSRTGVPFEFGLPRLLRALPEPSRSGVP